MTLTSKACIAAIFATLAIAPTSMARADALDDIMKAKVIKIAVPQDFAPFGSAGPDLKPHGYDIDMANLIGKELGVQTEIIPVTSANRIPYLQTKKADLVISSLGQNPEREKVIDFSEAYAPFFSGVYGTKDGGGGQDGGPRRQDRRRDARRDRGAGISSKSAPSGTTVKRYEDNNATISAFISGQVDLIATGNTVAAAIAEKSTARPPVLKFVIKDSPCYIGMNKDEPQADRQGERDHRQGKSLRRTRARSRRNG